MLRELVGRLWDHVDDLWSWLHDDSQLKTAERDLESVASGLTGVETYSTVLARAAFAIFDAFMLVTLIGAMAGCAVAVILGLGAETNGAVLLGLVLLALATPVLPWALLRKAKTVAKSKVLGAIVSRARRRAHEHAKPSLDAAAASGSPFAVSVDVTRAEVADAKDR